MSVFNAAEFDGHEQVVFINEPAVGLRAIIAIHNKSKDRKDKSHAAGNIGLLNSL